MSKLYDFYLSCKKNKNASDKTLYLFKSGAFFIFLDDDAKIASKLLNLKITYLTEDIVKCGFPINSLEKYSNKLTETLYTFEIVDTSRNIIYTINNYQIDINIKDLLCKICKIDTNNISVKDAYEFINNIQYCAKQIVERGNDNGNF